MRLRNVVILASTAALAIGLAGCSSTPTSTAPAAPPSSTNAAPPSTTQAAPPSTSAAPAQVTMTFWHNATQGKGSAYWEQAVAAFEAANPGVKINIEIVQNEDLDGKLQAAMQADKTPDIFFQRGGQKMADQVAAGKVADITALLDPTIKTQYAGSLAPMYIDGKLYGIPTSMMPEGFWYSKDLFDAAGVKAEDIKTIDDLIAAGAKLKATGVAPISLGAKDAWPAAHWFYQFGLRQCSQAEAQAMVAGKPNMDDPCWLAALKSLADFRDAKLFNDGFLTTAAQQGAGSSAGMVANHKAAMELMGAWNVGVIGNLTPDGNNLKDLGFFPFPSVPGGQGDPAAMMAGNDGYSCSNKAPQPACANFLNFFSTVEQQKLAAVAFSTIPGNPAASDAVADPAQKQATEALGKSPYTLLWFDTALGQKGNELNKAVVALLAGQVDPAGALAQIKAALA
ncbi:MAG: extracellular solute-binding protein [Actinomycetia bacterium]|nr:extracellular solute-binding protein [Actinomycetes bacterium]